MGLNTFNWSSSNNGNYIFYKPTPIVVATQTSRFPSSAAVPVVRAGAAGFAFTGVSSSGQSINLINYAGTVIALHDYTTYVTGARAMCFFLSSADSCIYILIGNSSNSMRLLKIADTTGTITAIGSAFTPITPANWGGWPSISGTLVLNTTSGHLDLTVAGYVHTINKTTGAVVSQNTPISFGSFSGASAASSIRAVGYVTSDGVLGVHDSSQGSSSTDARIAPTFTHATYGVIPSRGYHSSLDSIPLCGEYNSAGTLTPSAIIRVDSDKVYVAGLSSGNQFAPCLYSITDIDKYYISQAKWAAGVA